MFWRAIITSGGLPVQKVFSASACLNKASSSTATSHCGRKWEHISPKVGVLFTGLRSDLTQSNQNLLSMCLCSSNRSRTPEVSRCVCQRHQQTAWRPARFHRLLRTCGRAQSSALYRGGCFQSTLPKNPSQWSAWSFTLKNKGSSVVLWVQQELLFSSWTNFGSVWSLNCYMLVQKWLMSHFRFFWSDFIYCQRRRV